MAFNSSQVSVGTSATELYSLDNVGTTSDPVPVLIIPPAGVTVYVGGPGVTIANGCPITMPLSLDVVGEDILYGVVSAGPEIVGVLMGRQ
jgi:hypothetical protein